ncbi:hypothetical protein Trydic_g9069 [Trypoxylus dichotomus]
MSHTYSTDKRWRILGDYGKILAWALSNQSKEVITTWGRALCCCKGGIYELLKIWNNMRFHHFINVAVRVHGISDEPQLKSIPVYCSNKHSHGAHAFQGKIEYRDVPHAFV